MKKAIFVLFSFFCIFFVSCGKKNIVLRISEVHSADYPTSLALSEFARLVEERTDGRIRIEVHSDARLFDDEADAVLALQEGKLDFARVSLSIASSLSPRLNVLILPYLYKDRAHQIRVLSSEAGRRVLDSVSEDGLNLECLCWYDSGSRSFYLKKEVHSASDMAGLKIRVQKNDFMVKLCSLLGSTGVSGISTNDVYRSILNGLVDGAENNIPTYQNVGDYQAALFYIRDEHVRIPDLLLVSQKTLAKLSKADVKIIRECALETEAFERELWLKKEAESEKIIRDAGNVIIELTDEEKATFFDALQPLYSEAEEKYGDYLSEIQKIE